MSGGLRRGIGEALRASLRAQGLTQEAAAERVGVDRRTLQRWLSGAQAPPDDCVESLARLTGLRLVVSLMPVNAAGDGRVDPSPRAQDDASSPGRCHAGSLVPCETSTAAADASPVAGATCQSQIGASSASQSSRHDTASS